MQSILLKSRREEISTINKFMDAKGLFGENKFDKVLDDEELEQHIEKKKIREFVIRYQENFDYAGINIIVEMLLRSNE